MVIEHIAIWTSKIELMMEFYVKYFLAKAGRKYSNPATQFESYFLCFSSGARLELMYKPGVQLFQEDSSQPINGYAHLSFATGCEDNVNQLTNRLRKDGYRIIDNPRHTGDGYYESAVLDPEGNRIEITI